MAPPQFKSRKCVLYRGFLEPVIVHRSELERQLGHVQATHSPRAGFPRMAELRGSQSVGIRCAGPLLPKTKVLLTNV
jgi:hypothetical protein